MSQYFIVVNLDRKEYISPARIRDGAQLCSVHDAGTALSLTLLTEPGQVTCALTADGNGRGCGDIDLPYDEKLDGYPRKYKSYSDAWDAGWRPRNRTPSPEFDIIGSWAGDRIVTAGDYGDERKFITAKQYDQTKFMLELQRQRLVDAGEARPSDPLGTINLYKVARCLFKDVTPDCERVFKLGRYGRWDSTPDRFGYEIESYLGRRIVREFMQARGHKNFSMLTYEDIEALTRDYDAEQLKAFKAYLRKFALHPCTRAMLAIYRFDPELGVTWNPQKRQEIARKHDAWIERHTPSPPYLPELVKTAPAALAALGPPKAAKEKPRLLRHIALTETSPAKPCRTSRRSKS